MAENALRRVVDHRRKGERKVGAHFHLGVAGENGAVLQSISFTNNRATGTWNLTADQRNALLSNRVYVNVHTTLHPDGEIRGQVIKQ